MPLPIYQLNELSVVHFIGTISLTAAKHKINVWSQLYSETSEYNYKE